MNKKIISIVMIVLMFVVFINANIKTNALEFNHIINDKKDNNSTIITEIELDSENIDAQIVQATAENNVATVTLTPKKGGNAKASALCFSTRQRAGTDGQIPPPAGGCAPVRRRAHVFPGLPL